METFMERLFLGSDIFLFDFQYYSIGHGKYIHLTDLFNL